jgi:spore germination protein YaaH
MTLHADNVENTGSVRSALVPLSASQDSSDTGSLSVGSGDAGIAPPLPRDNFVPRDYFAPFPSDAVPNASFREIWGYLMNGEESFFSAEYPVTDIGYFGASLNYRGKLYGIPNRKKLASFGGRVHLVIAEVSNQALTHFCIDPEFSIRDGLIASIAEAAVPFDGVQIDFELVPATDAEAFYSFLKELKAKIGTKTLSVAIPARTRKIVDAYDYSRISLIADRIIVMAYDEHWSGSLPGSIASLDWCRRVATYATGVVPIEKLVMGLPFYGRAWVDANQSKAYKYSGISRLLDEKTINAPNRENSIPSFSYQELVTVSVFFEDSMSIMSRAKLYSDLSVRSIAFWRLGQEDAEIWNRLSVGGD